MNRKIKIGTRGSALAVRQSEIAALKFKEMFPTLEYEIVKITTKGDKILDRTLDKIGGKGVFVKEIELALLDGTIDVAVHSMKDMPDEMPNGLIIAGVSERENPVDVLVTNTGKTLWELPVGAKIGTGSLRRKYQLLALRSDIIVEPIRGNIETRMKKLDDGFDGIVLAAAGLIRMGYEKRISMYFNIKEMIPAGCQGILAYEIRENDEFMKKLINKVSSDESGVYALAERSFLAQTGAGCHAPVGVYAWKEGNQLKIRGYYYTEKPMIVETIGSFNDAQELGVKLGKEIVKAGL